MGIVYYIMNTELNNLAANYAHALWRYRVERTKSFPWSAYWMKTRILFVLDREYIRIRLTRLSREDQVYVGSYLRETLQWFAL